MTINKQVFIKIGTFEAHAKLAEAWFTYLGFAALTAIFHAASIKSESISLLVIKWVCYFFLLNWVFFKINQLIYSIYPSTNPVKGKVSVKATFVSTLISFYLSLLTYLLSLKLFEIFEAMTN